jgi:GT2 family glycosyltransferase
MRILIAKNGEIACVNNHRYDVWVREQGQESAVNAAVATTNTPWIFITNDDMQFPPGWWEVLSNTYFDIGCVSPKLIEPRPGAPTFEQYFCGGAGGDFNKEKWLKFADEYMKADLPRSYRTGFNLPFLIRRDIWDTIGGYDLNYRPFGSNSDSDLQAKLHLAGIQPYQNPGSIVYHFGETSGTSSPSNHSYWQKNWDYFISKWGFERASSPWVWQSQQIIQYDKLIYKPSWMGRYGKPV